MAPQSAEPPPDDQPDRDGGNHPRPSDPAIDAPLEPVEWISREDGIKLFDEAARRYLGMSGDEFRAAYAAGKFDDDPCDSHFVMVRMLLPFVED